MAALRLTTAGESHGPALTCIIEGLPASEVPVQRISLAGSWGMDGAAG